MRSHVAGQSHSPIRRICQIQVATALVVTAASLALLAVGCARARFSPATAEEAAQAPITITPPLKRVPVGEELEYSVYWWGMRVGTILFTVSPAPKKEWVKLACQARSNWALETFYPVRVSLTSLIEPAATAPQRFEGYVKRQWRVHESVVTFDWERNEALHQLPEGKEVSVAIEPATRDSLSMLYYVRTIPFQLGTTVPLIITADGKNWTLNGQILRAGMVKIGDLGRYPAVEGRVELAYPVPFFRGAMARVWFSADGKRVPLMAKIRSRVGPVKVVLKRRLVAGGHQ